MNDTTPLIKIVQIRSETDKDRLKHFTPDMRRIRQDWLDKFKAEDDVLSQEQLEAKYNSLENWFKAKAKSG